MNYLTLVRENLAKYAAERAALTAEAQRLVANKARYGAREEARGDEIVARLEELNTLEADAEARLAELEDNKVRQTAAATAYRQTPRRGGDAFDASWDPLRASSEELRSTALRVAERMTGGDAVRDAATRAVDAAFVHGGQVNRDAMSAYVASHGTDVYLRAFSKVVANPTTPMLTDDEQAAFYRAQMVQRAMSVGTPGAGGYGVPVVLDSFIMLNSNGYVDPMRRLATVTPIASKVWQGVSSAGVTGGWAAENVASTDGTPTLTQPDVEVHSARVFVPYSYEVGFDYGDDLVGELSRLAMDKIGDLESAGFWNGSGTNEPFGAIVRLDATSASEVVVTTDGVFQVADVYKLSENLPARFWHNAAWCGNRQVLNKIRRFGEGTTGSNSAFWTDLGGGQPSLLLGKPVHEVSAMPTFTGTTGAANILTISDWSQAYRIVTRPSVANVIPDLFDVTSNLPTATRGYFHFHRAGGDLIVPEAARLLQNQ